MLWLCYVTALKCTEHCVIDAVKTDRVSCWW